MNSYTFCTHLHSPLRVMTSTTRIGAGTGPAVSSAKNEIYKHCVETAIATANRIYDYRSREIDRTINEYIDMIPENIRNQKLENYKN